jgi:hypothetical protein
MLSDSQRVRVPAHHHLRGRPDRRRVRARRDLPARTRHGGQGPRPVLHHPDHRQDGEGQPADRDDGHPAAGRHHQGQRHRPGQRGDLLQRDRAREGPSSTSRTTSSPPRRSPRRRCGRSSGRSSSTSCSSTATRSTTASSGSSTTSPTRGASRSPSSRSRTSSCPSRCGARWPGRPRPSVTAAPRSSTPRASSRPPSDLAVAPGSMRHDAEVSAVMARPSRGAMQLRAAVQDARSRCADVTDS